MLHQQNGILEEGEREVILTINPFTHHKLESLGKRSPPAPEVIDSLRFLKSWQELQFVVKITTRVGSRNPNNHGKANENNTMLPSSYKHFQKSTY